MEIKTIVRDIDDSEDFDMQVNRALCQGSRLTTRKVMPGGGNFRPFFYAELEIDPDYEIEICEETKQIIESHRGTSSPSDYVNTALLLGIEAMERIKMSMAADDIEDGAAPDAEEEDDD